MLPLLLVLLMLICIWVASHVYRSRERGRDLEMMKRHARTYGDSEYRP